MKRATLADFLADNDWNLDLIQSPESDRLDGESSDLSGQLDQAHEVASVVFRQIDERHEVLAERYPFEITDDAVALDCRVDLEANAYAAVLALTIAHAFGVSSMHRPDEMFERIVLKVLQARGPVVGRGGHAPSRGQLIRGGIADRPAKKLVSRRTRMRRRDAQGPMTMEWTSFAISGGKRICGRVPGDSSARSR